MKKSLSVIFLLALSSSVNGWCGELWVQWTPNTEPDLVGYRLFRSRTSGDYTGITPVEIPKDQQYTDAKGIVWVYHYEPDLTENETYYWVVLAYDAQGLESEFSSEVSYTVPVQPPADPLSPGPAINSNYLSSNEHEKTLTASENGDGYRSPSGSEDEIFYASRASRGAGYDGPTVGGIAQPIDKLKLMAPWISLAALILLIIFVLFRSVRSRLNR